MSESTFTSDRVETSVSKPTEQTDSGLFREVVADVANGAAKVAQSEELKRINETAGAVLPDVILFNADPADMTGANARDNQPVVVTDSQPSNAQDAPVEQSGPGAAPDDARPIEISEIREKMFVEFGVIDTDGDNFLTEEELAAAAVDEKKFDAETREMIEALLRQREEIQDLSNDRWGSEGMGISRNDIRELDKANEEYVAAKRMEEFAQHHFDELDYDGDGFISADEIDQALDALPGMTEEHQKEYKENLDRMRDKLDGIEGASNDETGFENDGITRKDLDKYLLNEVSGNPNKVLLDNIERQLHRRDVR